MHTKSHIHEQGTVYHLVTRYKTENDIREELGTFDWDPLEGLDLENPGDSEDAVYAAYKWEMLLRVAGLDPEHPPDVGAMNKPQSPGEVEICPAVNTKLVLGYEIFSGRGQKLLDDRLFVRDELSKIMEDSSTAFILQECIVYVPADVLTGVELIDAPGIGVKSPQEQVHLNLVLRKADSIVVVLERNLQDNKEIKADLMNCGVVKRMIENPEQCPIMIFSAMNEKEGFNDLTIKSDRHNFHRETASIERKNILGLTQVLQDTFAGMRNAQMTEPQMLAACLPRLQNNIFSSYPLLWASLSLSTGEEDQDGASQMDVDSEETISRYEQEQLLCGLSKMLSSLNGCSREARLSTIMKNFFQTV